MRVTPHRPLRATALALLAVGAPAVAMACTVSATPVAFGSYNPLSAVDNDSTGNITVTCTPAPVAIMLSYTLSLSPGLSGSYGSRTLQSGAAALAYQLYRDPARSLVWGDGNSGSVLLSASLLLGVLIPVSSTHTVYGRIPARQNATPPGSYGDTITVTVSY